MLIVCKINLKSFWEWFALKTWCSSVLTSRKYTACYYSSILTVFHMLQICDIFLSTEWYCNCHCVPECIEIVIAFNDLQQCFSQYLPGTSSLYKNSGAQNCMYRSRHLTRKHSQQKLFRVERIHILCLMCPFITSIYANMNVRKKKCDVKHTY